MVVTGICFLGVTALVKFMGTRIPAAEAAFLRYALGLVLLLPMLKDFSQNLPDRDYLFYLLLGEWFILLG